VPSPNSPPPTGAWHYQPPTHSHPHTDTVHPPHTFPHTDPQPASLPNASTSLLDTSQPQKLPFVEAPFTHHQQCLVFALPCERDNVLFQNAVPPTHADGAHNSQDPPTVTVPTRCRGAGGSSCTSASYSSRSRKSNSNSSSISTSGQRSSSSSSNISRRRSRSRSKTSSAVPGRSPSSSAQSSSTASSDKKAGRDCGNNTRVGNSLQCSSSGIGSCVVRSTHGTPAEITPRPSAQCSSVLDRHSLPSSTTGVNVAVCLCVCVVLVKVQGHHAVRLTAVCMYAHACIQVHLYVFRKFSAGKR